MPCVLVSPLAMQIISSMAACSNHTSPDDADRYAYYHSPAWQEDYTADERGELPPGLKRGVLAQDTVYDLLTRNDELLKELRALLPEKGICHE